MHDSSVDEAVQQVCKFAASAPVQTTERSTREAKDFVLSAAVGLALANEGLSAGVHAEEGRVILTVDKPVIRLSRHRERLVEITTKVPGVVEASTRIGSGYKAPSLNPWSNIEAPPKIMLVDDEKEFVHTLSERLQTRDLKSSIAYDGEQALEMIQDEVPDVMVLDLMMPGIDGIEVLRRIKRDHPDVEVIILTGHGSDREKQIAEDLGAFAYLQKPVDVDLLARVMREAYGHPQSSTDDAEETSPGEGT
jgi:CheY-like chemotaxis protein